MAGGHKGEVCELHLQGCLLLLYGQGVGLQQAQHAQRKRTLRPVLPPSTSGSPSAAALAAWRLPTRPKRCTEGGRRCTTNRQAVERQGRVQCGPGP